MPKKCTLCGALRETTDHTRWSSIKKLKEARETETLNLLSTCKYCGFHDEEGLGHGTGKKGLGN